MSILEALNNTALAEYMRVSLWGYPIALTFHAIGMGILVGVVVVIDLRVLGVYRIIPMSLMMPMLRFAIIGFVVNLISGIFLFVADPVNYVENAAFLIKILAIILGLVVTVLMRRTPDFQLGQGGAAAVEQGGAAAVEIGSSAKTLAVVSLAIWAVAIIAGRMIGYV